MAEIKSITEYRTNRIIKETEKEAEALAEASLYGDEEAAEMIRGNVKFVRNHMNTEEGKELLRSLEG